MHSMVTHAQRPALFENDYGWAGLTTVQSNDRLFVTWAERKSESHLVRATDAAGAGLNVDTFSTACSAASHHGCASVLYNCGSAMHLSYKLR